MVEFETVDARDLLNGDIVVTAGNDTATVKRVHAHDDEATLIITFYGAFDNVEIFPDDPVTIQKRQ